jgi:SAM-dependent methyltransferase
MTQSRPVQAWVLDLLELQRGDIGSLAFPTGSFTKLYTVNCLPFRPSVPQGLAELRRVLVPEGRAVIAVRLYREGTGRANPSAYGFTDDELAELVTAVAHADLGRVTADRHERPRETIAALVSGA